MQPLFTQFLEEPAVRANVGGLCLTSMPLLRWKSLAICWTIDGIAIVSAIWAASILDKPADVHFGENAFITHWSSVHLMGLAVIAAVISRHRWREKPSATVLWLMMTGGFAFLALDESFAVHERLDLMIHEQLLLQHTPWTDRIDDGIVLCYGLIGLATLWFGRRELARFRQAWPQIALAFAIFFMMIVLDLLTNSYGVDVNRVAYQHLLPNLMSWANIVEESTKIFSEGAFLSAYVSMLLIERNCLPETSAVFKI